MYSFDDFYREFPLKKENIFGRDFHYRYYNNPHKKGVLVLLTGGVGMSDLFYNHFKAFSRDFSVITFDYEEEYKTVKEFTDAAAELLKRLGVKAWFAGQSLGGFVAQVIAKNHPEVTEGLILSNTGSLAKNMDKNAEDFLMDMLKAQKMFKLMLKCMPFKTYKWIMKKALSKKKDDSLTSEEQQAVDSIFGKMLEMLTRSHEAHMIDFMLDLINCKDVTKEDLSYLKDRVLLLLAEDDETFNAAVKESLAGLMTEPTVITDVTGGHLALLIHTEAYVTKVTEYISER